ncbi:MAG: hypothetical protein NXI00_23180, partial [Cytophagales bacterium]|nr:hypothetical protein [Cytophagales bacterium]
MVDCEPVTERVLVILVLKESDILLVLECDKEEEGESEILWLFVRYSELVLDLDSDLEELALIVSL